MSNFLIVSIAVFFSRVLVIRVLFNTLAVRYFVTTAERKKRAAAVSGSYPTTPAPLATVYRGSSDYYYFCADRWSESWSDFACRNMGFE